MPLKPAFIHPTSGGMIFQTGFKTLEKMKAKDKAILGLNATMAIAVSPYVDEDTCLYIPTRHIAFEDNKKWPGPSRELTEAIYHATVQVLSGNDVLVYCEYGRNRSGLVAALILKEAMDYSGADALLELRKLRKGAVRGNVHFETYLNSLG